MWDELPQQHLGPQETTTILNQLNQLVTTVHVDESTANSGSQPLTLGAGIKSISEPAVI